MCAPPRLHGEHPRPPGTDQSGCSSFDVLKEREHSKRSIGRIPLIKTGRFFKKPPLAVRNVPVWGATVLIVLLCCGGCGYAVGSAYQPEIRTVEIPVFTSSSYRRGVEYQLTEAVQKAIKTRTPFRVVKGPGADTRLTGHVAEVQKYVIGQGNFGDARELQITLDVQVTWEDLRSGEVLRRQRIPIEPELVPFRSQAEFAPEVGQSFASAKHLVVDRLANQVVEMMEQPW